MLKISIPKPCHEDWQQMTPQEQGRHCAVCAKTVVDFTNMTDDEVKNYFITRKDEKLCGRFRNEQLDRITIQLPANIFSMEMPVWKKFLVACLLAYSTMLFSCDSNVQGKVLPDKQTVEMVGSKAAINSYNFNGGMVGMINLPVTHDSMQPPLITQVCTVTQGVTMVEPIYTKGDIAVAEAIPDPPKIDTVANEIIMGKPAYVEPPPIKMGIVAESPKKDMFKKALPAKKDSANCNNAVYY